MANTYTKIYLHIIFAVKNSNSLIPAIYLRDIHAYICGILKNHGHYVYAVGGIDSHVHILIGYNINQSIPDLVRDVKSSTTTYIKSKHIIPYRFEWQTGYGCFSYSRSQLSAVSKYVNNQNEHHKSMSLTDEIKSILAKYDIEFDERYIINDPQ